LTAKDTVRDYFNKLGAGDARGAFALMSEDVQYRLIGSTPLSVDAHGMREAIKTIIGPFTSRLVDQQIELKADELIAEGDTVVALARSKAMGLTGLPYENEYAMVFRVRDGKITSLVEYLDTALVETAVFGKKLVEPEP
jgi:ketosteroid isomerase-like protein